MIRLGFRRQTLITVVRSSPYIVPVPKWNPGESVWRKIGLIYEKWIYMLPRIDLHLLLFTSSFSSMLLLELADIISSSLSCFFGHLSLLCSLFRTVYVCKRVVVCVCVSSLFTRFVIHPSRSSHVFSLYHDCYTFRCVFGYAAELCACKAQ